MVGFTKDSFSMNSRNRVHLPDVELIVKDLLRKQELVEVVPDLRLVVVTATEAGENNLRFEHLRGMVAGAILPAIGG